jgi:hypothetical protein
MGEKRKGYSFPNANGSSTRFALESPRDFIGISKTAQKTKYRIGTFINCSLSVGVVM